MTYDIIISGVGPAGSKYAEIIAKVDYGVALIEKDIDFRKPCGEGIPRSEIYDIYPELSNVVFVKHPEIKAIIREFKYQLRFVGFFYENEGDNLNIVFKMAEENEEFRRIAIYTIISGEVSPKDFISRIKSCIKKWLIF